MITILLFNSCEKEFYEDVYLQNQNSNKTININSISLEKFNSKMRMMKNKPEIEGFMISSNNNLAFNRTSSPTEFEIITNDIKEITQGDYTSYTMYVKTPDTTNNIYNITIEEVNDNTSLFLTKYEPTNNWTITSNQNFEGNITTFRINNIITNPSALTVELTEAFESLLEGSGSNTLGSGASGSNIYNTYPYDCDGHVHSTTIITETKCGCGHDWQDFLSDDCTGCDGALPAFPNLSTNTVYECIPTNYNPIDGATPANPGGTSAGGSNNTGNNNTGGTSLTTIVGGPAPDATKDPCKVFEEALDPLKQNLNHYINDLVTKHQQSVKNEVSYSFSKTPQYDPNTDAYTAFGNYNATYKEGGPTSVAIETGKLWHSSIHLHPKAQEEASGIFSWLDIKTLADAYNEVTPDLKSEFSMMIVAPDPLNLNNHNVYALKVKDISLLSQAIANEWSSPEWSNIADVQERLKAIQRDLGGEYIANKNNLAQFFLQKFSNYGISLFQLQNNQWKELVLNNTTNQLEEKPCNN